MSRKGIALAAAFAILLAAALASAAGPPGARGTSFEGLWTYWGWQAVATVAVMVSLLIVALAYMLGIAFRQPQITAWARNELYQALASAFMLAFIVGFVYFLANFTSLAASAFAGPEAAGDPCSYATLCPSGTTYCEYHIDKAWCIVSELEINATKQADHVLNMNMRAAGLAAIGKYFDLSWGGVPPYTTYPWPACFGEPETCASAAMGVGFSLYAGTSMLVDGIGLITPVLFTWISSFIAQAVFLALVRDAFFPIFLTMGLILRTFFFTRKLGGLLIAIAIGIYTIYPFMYVLLADQYQFIPFDDKYDSKTCLCGGFALTDLIPVVGGALKDYSVKVHCPVRWCSMNMIEIILWGKVALWDLGVEPVETSLSGVVGYAAGSNPHPADFLFALCQKMGELMVPGLVIPMISLLVTVSFIKGLSPLLGGDVEIAGLTHLI